MSEIRRATNTMKWIGRTRDMDTFVGPDGRKVEVYATDLTFRQAALEAYRKWNKG